ncbi:MAG: N-6 DNA methylase [Bacteroidales bacterium]|nr:N-6 DNA methylase [Lachnoclostridium sp.]MCM1383392.1 N-6 DNA methylase [Lachnoclostridium sp.]MCM1464240.1 N-6 DNA methylase [Bacteroidales bacterium]
MAIEQYTENLTLKEMKCSIGKNDFGYVFPQGDVSKVDKIEKLLKQAGGKPKECNLDDYSKGGNGKAKPEFIITFNDDINTIIVVECKNSVKKHQSEELNKPSGYAVDGVLYYAKFLKQEYNVVAVAVSGTSVSNMKVDTFYWQQKMEVYSKMIKARDIILEPLNYLELVKGNKLQKAYSLDEIRNTAIDMHNYLREIKITEAHKPIFIAGILIALNDPDFSKTYAALTSYKLVMQNIQNAIENILKESDIKSSRIDYIKQVFNTLQENTKFSEIPLGHFKSITWYIEQLELKIKPMMDYADNTIDALGVFYHQFIKYSGGDGSGLGIVLTPQHLTEFMCELANVNKNSRVIDICCGSGSFLVTAMSYMFKDANPDEVENIRKNGLYGVEFDDGLYMLAIANMIIRKDGKSNIYKGDCFNSKIVKELKEKNINIGLINPPYSQKDVVELEFVEHLLDILVVGGIGVVVVPMSCAIGTKFKEVRERLLKKHTLKAVFSMPDEVFYPTATNVCVMVWEAHNPHDEKVETFFGYCKEDGFEKRKYVGRVDANNKWNNIKNEWLSLYRNRDIKDGLSARQCVSYNDEWLCEAYMKVDFSKVSQCDFEQTVRDYLAFEIKHGMTSLDNKYKHDNTSVELNVKKWKEFKVEDLFTVERGKINNLNSLTAGKCPIVSAYGENQGIAFFADEEIKYSNCLTASMNGSKTGYVTFHGYGFNANADCGVLIPKFTLDIYAGLFIATVMKQFSYKYIYGRKLTKSRLNAEIIKLPVNKKGKIDLEYMKEYMMSLPYSDKI